MGKKFLHALLIAVIFFGFKGYSQTTAPYNFSAFTSTFNSIAATGTPVTGAWLGDDRTQVSIPIGFSFVYCTTPYSFASVCTNGWLSLTNSGSIQWDNIPGNIGGPAWLMPCWDDLVFAGGGNGYYQTTGLPGSQVFTFEWKDGTLYPNFGATPGASFQIKLYEGSNIIDFCYGNCSWTVGSNSPTIGISNITATAPADYRTLPISVQHLFLIQRGIL